MLILQERLDRDVQKEILAELRTQNLLRANLDVIDIVLGFLSTGGGRPEKMLGDYIRKVLKMKKPFSEKVLDFAVCTSL